MPEMPEVATPLETEMLPDAPLKVVPLTTITGPLLPADLASAVIRLRVPEPVESPEPEEITT